MTKRLEFAHTAEWYETRSLGDGVTLIHEPFIEPFFRCNMWLVRGRVRDLLIDTGMGVVPLRANVPALTGRPIIAVASHAHFDHIGAHHEFEDCAIHRDEHDILCAPDNVATLADSLANRDIFTKLPPGWRDGTYQVKATEARRLLQEGDVLDLGDRVFEVLHVPGHSPGSIALWEEKTGILFSGDTVYDGPLISDAYHSDISRYVESMERLRDYPVSVVHGGHYPSVGRETFCKIIAGFLDEHRRSARDC